MSESYYDYCRGLPVKPDTVEVEKPLEQVPELHFSHGMIVEEERFDSMSGLYRRLAEKLGGG